MKYCEAGYKPTGGRMRLCLSLQDLLVRPLPSALSRASEMQDASVYSACSPHYDLFRISHSFIYRQQRNLVALQRALSCLREIAFLRPEKVSIKSAGTLDGGRRGKFNPLLGHPFNSTTKPVCVLSHASSHSC